MGCSGGGPPHWRSVCAVLGRFSDPSLLVPGLSDAPRTLRLVADRIRQLAVVLASVQLIDVLGNAVVPREYVDAHLDHLQVPRRLRPLLSPIKLTSSAGLLAGLEMPRLGALTAAASCGYYAIAVRYHVRAGDHPVLCVPAALLGGAAAVTLLSLYLPAARAR